MLLEFQQMNKEFLASYTKRFHDEVRPVAHLNPSVLINAYIDNYQLLKFFYLVIIQLLTIFLELLQETNRYIIV